MRIRIKYSLAVAELEAAAARSRVVVAAGTASTTSAACLRPPPPLPRTSKRLLNNTIRAVVSHNRRQTQAASADSGRNRRKTDAQLEAIIDAHRRRERRLRNVDVQLRCSYRKPASSSSKRTADDCGRLDNDIT